MPCRTYRHVSGSTAAWSRSWSSRFSPSTTCVNTCWPGTWGKLVLNGENSSLLENILFWDNVQHGHLEIWTLSQRKLVLLSEFHNLLLLKTDSFGSWVWGRGVFQPWGYQRWATHCGIPPWQDESLNLRIRQIADSLHSWTFEHRLLLQWNKLEAKAVEDPSSKRRKLAGQKEVSGTQRDWCKVTYTTSPQHQWCASSGLQELSTMPWGAWSIYHLIVPGPALHVGAQEYLHMCSEGQSPFLSWVPAKTRFLPSTKFLVSSSVVCIVQRLQLLQGDVVQEQQVHLNIPWCVPTLPSLLEAELWPLGIQNVSRVLLFPRALQKSLSGFLSAGTDLDSCWLFALSAGRQILGESTGSLRLCLLESCVILL